MFTYDPQSSMTVNLDFRYRNFLNLRGNRNQEINIGDLSQQGLARNRFDIEKHLIACFGAHIFDLTSEDTKILLSEYLPSLDIETKASHLLAVYEPIGDCAHPFTEEEIAYINDALAPVTEPTDFEVFSHEAFRLKEAELSATHDVALQFLLNWIRDCSNLNAEFAAQMVRLGVVRRVVAEGETSFVPITVDQARNLKFDAVYSISIQSGRMSDEMKRFLDQVLFVLAFRASDETRPAFLRMTDTGSRLEMQIRADLKTRQVQVPRFFRKTVTRQNGTTHFAISFYLLSNMDAQLVQNFLSTNPHLKPAAYFDAYIKNKSKANVAEGKVAVTSATKGRYDYSAIPQELITGMTPEEVRAFVQEQSQAIQEFNDRYGEKKYVVTKEEKEQKEQSIKERIEKRGKSKVRKQESITMTSKIEHADTQKFSISNLFMYLDTMGVKIEEIDREKANFDFFSSMHIYYTARQQTEEADQDSKHLFAFQRSLQFSHNFHYDSNEFTVTTKGFVNVVDLLTFERFQQSYDHPTVFYVDFIIGVLSFLKSGHHASSANIVNMATKVYGALGYNYNSEEVRQRIRCSIYHGSHVGSMRMQLLYVYLRHQTNPLSNAIVLRLNTNPPLSMPFLNLSLYIEGLAKVQFFRFFGAQLYLNIMEFRENIDTINKIKHFAAPYANYLYGKTVTIPASIVEQLNRFAPLARALAILLPTSSLNMSASLRKMIVQASSIDINSDITVQAYITAYRSNIRQITAASLAQGQITVSNE